MNTKKSNPKKLLSYFLTAGVITVLSMANPSLPYYILRAYIKNKKFQKNIFLQDLKRLQKRELIDYKQLNNGEVKIILKGAGKKLSLQYDIDNMSIKRPFNWDGKWRLIIFDIPNKKRVVSNVFRSKLQELGLYKLQNSVYLHPFSCEKEIEFIAEIFNIRNHIILMTVSEFEGEEKIKKHFSI